MENPALAQQLKVLLLCAIGLIFAAILGWNIGSENYSFLVLGALAAVLIAVTFLTGRYFWILTIASSFLGGTFPILGGQFTPFQVLMGIGVGKFLLGDVILRRKKFRLGPRFDLVLVAGFMSVVMYHGLHDRFGMRFLGSSVWGGRNYVNVCVGLAAFFVVQSTSIRANVWAKLLYAVLAVSSFDLLIALITTIFPASIYKIYPFYSAVSQLGIEEILTGQVRDVTERVGAFGNFGFILMALVLSATSLRVLIRPGNFSRLFLAIVGFFAVLYSGFRSAVLNTLILWAAAGIRDLKVAALALLPLFAAILFSLAIIQSQFIALPKQFQRGLAFLPGDWDTDMTRNATDSNEFRQNTWKVWRQDFFPEHPWLGRGFGFKSEWTQTSIRFGRAVDYQQMVETGNIHNGFFSTVDSIGIIGTVFFVIWNIRILNRAFRIRVDKKLAGGIALPFVAIYLIVWICAFWIGALTLGSFLPQEFGLVAVFMVLYSPQPGTADPTQPKQDQKEIGPSRRLLPA